MLETQKADEITTALWGSFQFLENLDGVVKKTLSNFTEIWFNQFSGQIRIWAAKFSIYNRNEKGSMEASEPPYFIWKRCTPLSTTFEMQ